MGEGRGWWRRGAAVVGRVALWAPTLALAGMVAHAAATDSAASGAPAATPMVTALPAAPASVPTATLPPVEVPPAPTPPQSDTSATTNASIPGEPSLQQTMSVEILPGPLTVTPSSETVTLSPGLGSASAAGGTLSTITVIDARGSLVGWRVTVSLQSVRGITGSDLAGVRLCAQPDPVTIVAGNPQDVVRSSPGSCAGVGGTISVFAAAAGGGGGTYSDTAVLTLEAPNMTGAQITATLSVAVH
jgi:hypothetical protein